MKINYELAFCRSERRTLSHSSAFMCAYLNVYARHREDLQRRILLRREAEELALSLVPLHGVERVALQVVLTD